MKWLPVLTLVFASSFGGAQSSLAASAWNWLQGEWKVVKQNGREAANRVVREYPQRFKGIKAQVTRVTQVAGQFADTHRLQEKKELLIELWEVRGSLDILALCSPDVIHELTGLDAAGVANLEAQVTKAYKRLAG